MSSTESPHSRKLGQDEDRVDRIRQEWAEAVPELDTSALEITGRVLGLAAAIEASAKSVLADYGLGIGDFSVLVTLRRIGKTNRLSPGEITDATMVSGGATTQRLDRLERAKLIRRQPDPTDRRAQRIHLTAKGTRTAEKTMAMVAAGERALLAPLDPGDRAALAELLKLLGAATDDPASDRP